VITSTRNKRVADAAKLKKRGLREQYRRFLVEGAQATGEGVEAGALESLFVVPGGGGRIPDVTADAATRGIDVLEVSEAVIAHLTSAVTPQGIAAVSRFVDVPLADLPSDGVVAVLCSVRDPGNAGTVLRSADAAGAAGVVFTKDSVDVYNQKTVRASAGSLFHLPVVRNVDVAEAVSSLRAGGRRVLAADANGDVSMLDADLSRPTALLLGNEAWGLPEEVRSLADGTVRVPIEGRVESLNLAAAAALLLFESARRRGGEGMTPGDLPALIRAFAHDLRLPLTALKGFATTLVERWDRFADDARKELVSGMLLDLDRVAAMVSLVVDAARLESGDIRLPTESHEVAPVLASLSSLFERSPDYPPLEATGAAIVALEPPRLHALLVVLCEGALWWGREGPIRVEARQEGSMAVIELRRTGTPPDDPEMAFAGPAQEGSKIGLHIARRLADSLGGSLVLEPADEIRFRLSLPG
jgi:TrmH family RNA methyltransferase